MGVVVGVGKMRTAGVGVSVSQCLIISQNN